MSTVNTSLHKEFLPFVPEPVVEVLWDRWALLDALAQGPSHPKFLRAATLRDKCKAKEAHVRRAQSAEKIGFLEGNTLTRKGWLFLRAQMERAKTGNPAQKAQWGTMELGLATLKIKRFDVVVYPPKKISEGARLWAYLMTEKDMDKKVEAAVKLLLHDEDQVDSESPEFVACNQEMSAADFLVEDEEDARLREKNKDDKDQVVMDMESDPRSLRDKILDLWISWKEDGQFEAELSKLLLEVADKFQNFGSDKDYVVMPEHGDVDFDNPTELEEFFARMTDEMIHDGYSDRNNYRDLDLDIPTYEEYKDDCVVGQREYLNPKVEHLEPEVAAAVKATYERVFKDLLDSQFTDRDKAMLRAYHYTVKTHAPGQFQEVAISLANAV